MIATKSVEYSYPSSLNAVRYHMPDGCYCVELHSPGKFPHVVSAHATRDAAMKAAAKITAPWNPMWLRFRLDWVQS